MDLVVLYTAIETVIGNCEAPSCTVNSKWGFHSVYQVQLNGRVTLLVTKHVMFQSPDGEWLRWSDIREGDSVRILGAGCSGVITGIKSAGYRPVKEILFKGPVTLNGIWVSSTLRKRPMSPVISYGIIARHALSGKYLVIRRRHSMAFIDLIRGRYFNRDPEVMARTYLSEMSLHERQLVATKGFDALWEDIWSNPESKGYKFDFRTAKQSFGSLNIQRLLRETKGLYLETEYGFPKGRRNANESALDCARREFQEETGVSSTEFCVLPNTPTIEETYTATNGILYKHVYYLASLRPTLTQGRLLHLSTKQLEEVDFVLLAPKDQCMLLFRPYDSAKRRALTEAHNVFEKPIVVTNGRRYPKPQEGHNH